MGKVAMTGLYRVMKDKDISMHTKVRFVKALVFPVMMYGCESWTIRESERRKIDAFELWCWRRMLRIPLTARRTNKSVLEDLTLIHMGFFELLLIIIIPFLMLVL